MCILQERMYVPQTLALLQNTYSGKKLFSTSSAILETFSLLRNNHEKGMPVSQRCE